MLAAVCTGLESWQGLEDLHAGLGRGGVRLFWVPGGHSVQRKPEGRAEDFR